MTKSVSRGPDLLHGPVFSNMTRFFLPIMLGSLLQQLYSMVDAVVLGRLVGKTALAAVGGAGPIFLVYGGGDGAALGQLVQVVRAEAGGKGDHEGRLAQAERRQRGVFHGYIALG